MSDMKYAGPIFAAAILVLVFSAPDARAGEPPPDIPEKAKKHMEKATELLKQLDQAESKKERKALTRKALAEIRSAHKIAPENIRITYTLGIFYYKTGKYDKTITTLKPLVDNNKDHKYYTNALETVAYSYAKQAKYRQSEKYFKKRLEKKPGEMRTLKNLLRVYKYWKKRSKLIEISGKILEKEYDKDTALQLGLAFLQSKKFKKAIPVFEKVLKENPKESSALRCLAQCCQEMKDYDKAIEYAEKFLEEHPDHKDVKKVKRNLKTYRRLKKRADKKKKGK